MASSNKATSRPSRPARNSIQTEESTTNTASHLVQVAFPLHLAFGLQDFHLFQVLDQNFEPPIHQRDLLFHAAQPFGSLEQLLVEVNDGSRHRYTSFISRRYHMAHSFTRT